MSEWKLICRVDDIPVLGSRRVARDKGLDVAVFRNDDDCAAAEGHFVHVYVDRASNRPLPVPDAVRQAVAPLSVRASPASA